MTDKRKDPRYKLRNENIKAGRFSIQSWIRNRRVLNTVIYDISKTGASFIVPFYQAPKVGDAIAFEFTIPGSGQIACMGRVMSVADAGHLNEYHARIEKFPHVKVGIKFEKLPEKYVQLLDGNLKNLVSKNVDQQLRELGIAVKATVNAVPYPLIIAIVSVLAVFLMGSFVTRMQHISESKWWLKEAKDFSEHMKYEKAKEDAKSFSSESK